MLVFVISTVVLLFPNELTSEPGGSHNFGVAILRAGKFALRTFAHCGA